MIFLFIFLPVVMIINGLLPKKFRNLFLLIANLLFYAYGEPIYVLLMIASIVINYLCALWIEKSMSDRVRKVIMILNVIINIGALGFFKYTTMILDTLRVIPVLSTLPAADIVLPIGISFYTFQAMSYVIDVYRGSCCAAHSFIDFASYISLFPQLIAGPIVRYSDVERKIRDRRVSVEMFSNGIKLFVIGLCKKVLLANQFGMVWDTVSSDVTAYGMAGAWVGAIGYTLQIYFDFGGYSDMARGLGKMLGFDFCINFSYPYISRSITEFWRRWHISLSTWFKDYVYIPLGGNRVKPLRHAVNILIVWTLTGLWHGAAWNFVAWGVGYGLILLAERFFIGKLLDRIGPLRYVYTLLVTLVMFTVFSGTDVLSTLGIMFGGAAWSNAAAVYYLKSYAVILAVAAIGSTPVIGTLGRKIECTKAVTVLEPIMVAGLLLLSTAYLEGGSFKPFLYFRF